MRAFVITSDFLCWDCASVISNILSMSSIKTKKERNVGVLVQTVPQYITNCLFILPRLKPGEDAA